jgi:hypothetical protein
LITALDADTQEPVTGATSLAYVTDASNFPYLVPVSITGTSTTATVLHTGHGLSTGDAVWIQGTDEVYYGAYDITVINEDYYSYTTAATITVSPATGSPTATFCFINGFTDENGQISDSRVVNSDQPIVYRVRKSTAPEKLYRTSAGVATVDSDLGVSITANLIPDE